MTTQLPERIPPFQTSEAAVLNKTDYFSTISVWPLTNQVDPRRWLSNFNREDRRLAATLLNSFIYIPEPITKALFAGTFHHISNVLNKDAKDARDARERWSDFRRDLIITYVEGENPHPTDSGLIFTRYARDEIRIPEIQIMAPERAMRILLSGSMRPIVFVDDFVGSGHQMHATWHRKYSAAVGAEFNFAELCNETTTNVFYIPLLATSKGLKHIHETCPNLRVLPGHELDAKDSPLHPDSLAWPDDLRQKGIEFIERVSAEIGIPLDDCKGYDDLGLAIAFSHTVPDATLPIFYFESDSWHPLLKRR